MKLSVTIGERRLVVQLPDSGGAPLLDGEPLEADVVETRPGVLSVVAAGRSFEVTLDRPGTSAPGASVQSLSVDGWQLEAAVEDERRRSLAQSTGAQGGRGGAGDVTALTAPMPGRVVGVPAEAGQHVERGAPLVVLEAMKMESALGAPHAGTVVEVLVSPGQTVQQRQPLVRIERSA